MHRILRRAGKTAQIVLTGVLALVLVCNVYLIVAPRVLGAEHPDVFGFSAAVVVSGSMEPSLSVGDLIVNQRQTGYREGDIITFRNGETLTTHRIVGTQDGCYVTQGDANNAADLDPVPPEDVAGRVVFAIPHLGNVISLLKTPFGMTALVFIGLVMIELPLFQRRREVLRDEGN